MAVEKIANRQLFFILFLARSTLKIAFLPVVTSADALQDAWISAILSFFGGALLVIAIGGLAVRFPNETMVQYSQKLLGKWPGKALSLLPLGAFLFMSSAELRIYAEALTTLFITETPLVFGIGTMGFAAALSLRIGEFLERIEVLAMFAWGLGHFIAQAVFLYCGAKGLSQVLGLKSYRILVGPMAVIWITLAVHGYSDFFQLKTIFQPGIAVPLAFGFVLVPNGILWLAYGIRALAGRLKPGAP